MEKRFSYTLSDESEKVAALSVTSANVLCKYMRKPEYLHEILKNMAIKPRYVEEIIDYIGVDALHSISIPMVCFCDIPLSKVSKHSEYYGTYGIALDKNQCVNKNVQPVTYVNVNSGYYKDFSNTILNLFSIEEQPASRWKFLADFVLTQMLYSKPVYGETVQDAEIIKRLFKDECEWRFIPTLSSDMDLILTNKKNTQEGRDLYNRALAREENASTWLSFSPSEISYLIVPDENAAIDLIGFISKELIELDESTRQRLISKIEIANKISSNFI